MRKLTVLVAGGIGYVLGTRAGRERYDQIRALANQVKNNPKVQAKAHQAADAAPMSTHPWSRTSSPTPPARRRARSSRRSGSGRRGPAAPRQHRAAGRPLPAGQPALSLPDQPVAAPTGPPVGMPRHRAGVGERGDLVDHDPAPRRVVGGGRASRRRTTAPARRGPARRAPPPAPRASSRCRDITATRSSARMT